MTRVLGTIIMIGAFLFAIGFLLPGCHGRQEKRISNIEEYQACVDRIQYDSRLTGREKGDMVKACYTLWKIRSAR